VTIGDFIRARVDDDELLAEHMLGRYADQPGDLADLGTWHPRRVLALCAARRHLVLDHRAGTAVTGWSACTCGREGSPRPPCSTLRALALEWRSHPDYRAEWRAHPVPGQARSA
jgi:hypothetical protein